MKFNVYRKSRGQLQPMEIWDRDQVETAFPELSKLFEHFTVDKIELKVSKGATFLHIISNESLTFPA